MTTNRPGRANWGRRAWPIAGAVALSMVVALAVVVAGRKSKDDRRAASVPAANGRNCQAIQREFESVYGLAPGKAIRCVPPPFPPIRMEHYRCLRPIHSGTDLLAPISMIFSQSKDALVLMSHNDPAGPSLPGPSGHSLETLLRHLLNVYPQRVDCEERDLLIDVPGDFVVREGCSLEQGVADLNAILGAATKPPRSLTLTEKERMVIVVGGNFQPNYLAGHEGWIEIYGTRLQRTDEFFGRGAWEGDFPTFLKWIGWNTEPRSILIDGGAKGVPAGPFQWEVNGASDQSAFKKTHRLDLVLRRIQEQTGLSFQKQTRKVKILEVK